MRILHINTNFEGGAAKAAIRIHLALLKSGVESHMLFLRGSNIENLPNVHFISELISPLKFIIIDKFNRILNKRFSFFKPPLFFNSPYSLFKIHKLPFVQSFDIINLHWVVKFVDIPSFFTHINKPIVWTLHDMNPFSGGIHYLTDYSEAHYGKLENKFRNIKNRAYINADITIVSPSQWLLEKARDSGMFPAKAAYHNIYNCIDTSLFIPKKNEVNSENNKNYKLLFIADNTEDKRKGMRFLIELVLKLNSHKNLIWTAIGKTKKNLPNSIIEIGHISSDKEMIEKIQESDLYLITSIEDNLPNTILEAMSCGIPVVGFNIGGVPEIVVNNQTGLATEVGDLKGIEKGIFLILENYSFFSCNARKFAVENFNYTTIASKYASIYKQSLLLQ
jgi:glycosyltransferase involved in cell wall biosynthesis